MGRTVETVPALGGVRYWFRRPLCWGQRRVIYLPPGDARFGCRKCHRLRYASQREDASYRLHRRARKLFRRAGSWDGSEPWQKPSGMWWDTFSRLVLEAGAGGAGRLDDAGVYGPGAGAG